MHWEPLIGQERVVETLTRSVEKKQIGQAYLFSGIAGIGTFTTARQLALILLCESEEKPCMTCPSCTRLLAHAHPDFRYLFPINFAPEHKVKSKPGQLTAAGWEYISARAKTKLENPYMITPEYSANTAVDWIREINKTIQRGPTEAPHSVVIIEGIEHFRAEAANAMLKTLEEPPANTVIILLCRSIHQVLPTVLSRCQLFRFTAVPDSQLLEECQKRYPEKSETELQNALFRAKGSPGVAFSILEESDEIVTEATANLIKRVGAEGSAFEKALALETFVSETLQENHMVAQQVIETFIEEVRISFLAPYLGDQNYIYGGAQADFSLQIKSPQQAERIVKIAEASLLSIKRHTSLLIIFTEFELSIMDILHDKE